LGIAAVGSLKDLILTSAIAKRAGFIVGGHTAVAIVCPNIAFFPLRGLKGAVTTTGAERNLQRANFAAILFLLAIRYNRLHAIFFFAVITFLKTIQNTVSTGFNRLAFRIRCKTARIAAGADARGFIAIDRSGANLGFIIAITLFRNPLLIGRLDGMVTAKGYGTNRFAVLRALLVLIDARLPITFLSPFGNIITTGLVIAGITDAIPIRVGLVWIRDRGTAVDIAAGAIMILVICRVIGASITGIPHFVMIRVLLIGIINTGTIIDGGRNTIRIRILAVASTEIETLVGTLLADALGAPISRSFVFKVCK